MRITSAIIFSALAVASISLGQTRGGASEHWVATWATSQPLAATSTLGRGGPPPSATQQSGARSGPPIVAQGQGRGRGGPPVPASINDQTVRMVVHTSIGGRRVRVQLSNAAAASPLVIGSAHIAVRAKDSAIVAGTDRVLTFSAQPGCTIRPGVLMMSDPVDLDVAALSDLAVSIYVPKDSGPPTNHNLGLHTAYVSKGDTTAQEVMPEPATTRAYLWLSAVDVAAAPNVFTIVTLGDSITDGQGTTVDANLTWSADLARKLAAKKATSHIGVVNSGVAGGQVLRDDSGVSALARFDRDVLSRSGAKWMILLEAINDIVRHGQDASPDPVTSEDLIAGYRQLIARAHTHGIQVIGATVTPAEGQRQVTERMQAMRTAVNQWIRTSRAFDAVVDLDAAVRDPEHPLRLRAEFDSGDHIHLNDAGNQAMADAIDVTVFRK
ncbi:MAG TPA: SGNH/GDSL hydrolase family protein [Bryobacteraceae bacterium]|nr:SGNH/GDSL hydrolase family protein [Bryobacteraceae bacterium]